MKRMKLWVLGIQQDGHRRDSFPVVFTIDAHILFSPGDALLGYLCLFVSAHQVVIGILNLQGDQFALVLAEIVGFLFLYLLALIFELTECLTLCERLFRAVLCVRKTPSLEGQ